MRPLNLGWESEMQVIASDGQGIAVDVITAVGSPRATVILLHAMMCDRRSFRGERGLPGVLAASGFECRVADFRGRGGSPAPSFAYDDLVNFDVPALVADARSLGRPVVIVGHSLGAHVALAAAAAARADAYVLLGGNVWMPRLDASRHRRLLRSLTMTAFKRAARGGAFPARALRMGPVDEPKDYVDDLVRFWREDRWASRAGVDYLAGLGAVDVPVLSFAGSGDRLMAHPVGARAFAAHLPRASFRVVGRASGLRVDVGHMGLVTDEASRPVWSEAALWLRQVL